MSITRLGLLTHVGAVAAVGVATPTFAKPLIALPDDLALHDAATTTAIRTSSAVVALTFDDGPHPHHTPRLLQMLRERGIVMFVPAPSVNDPLDPVPDTSVNAMVVDSNFYNVIFCA